MESGSRNGYAHDLFGGGYQKKADSFKFRVSIWHFRRFSSYAMEGAANREPAVRNDGGSSASDHQCTDRRKDRGRRCHSFDRHRYLSWSGAKPGIIFLRTDVVQYVGTGSSGAAQKKQKGLHSVRTVFAGGIYGNAGMRVMKQKGTKNTIRKRIQKKQICLQASYTIEAALLLPLFLFAILKGLLLGIDCCEDVRMAAESLEVLEKIEPTDQIWNLELVKKGVDWVQEHTVSEELKE